MSRPSLTNGTPCPVPARRLTNTSIFPGWHDETTDIDYTRVVRAGFQHARPKRPRKRVEEVKIFEDVMEGEELIVANKDAGTGRGGTLLGRRPQRRPGGVVLGAVDRDLAVVEEDAWTLAGQEIEEKAAKGQHIVKEARRRTIFVPSDETTMMTIHPGARDTERLEDTFQMMSLQPKISPRVEASRTAEPVLLAAPKPVRRSRISLAMPPRRLPLQMLQSRANNMPDIDVHGKNGGKENVAPGVCAIDDRKAPQDQASPRATGIAHLAKPSLYAPTASSLARQALVQRDAAPRTRPQPAKPPASASPRTKLRAGVPVSVHSTHSSKHTQSRIAQRQSPAISTTVSHTKEPVSEQHRPWRASKNYVSAALKARANVQAFPVLATDVERPGLYEDSWLDHEEVALTAVINQMFDNARPSDLSKAEHSLLARTRMLEMYQGPETAALHDRLQASLTYGALSKPSNGDASPAVTQDLGLRKRYMSLWLESYDFATLKSAAEIVVGRSVEPSSSMRNSSEAPCAASLDGKASRRGLISFFETFFVSAADVNETGHRSDVDVRLRARNKTIIRSLMLIRLLDCVALSETANFCLFEKTSTHKSSASVLTALASLLLPSIGDIGRVLRHLEYELSYVQDPLDEVTYRIDNIAVDLRDGIFFTRLVEILLFGGPAARDEALRDHPGDDMTLTLSDATVLLSSAHDVASGAHSRPLSQHLKMPCFGHAQKVYNVDIALSALKSHPRICELLPENITNATIVDGHREQTLGLLWSLISTVGIDQLLDRRTIEADTHHRTATCGTLEHLDMPTLLHRWAAAHCAPQGIEVSNLTMSFADGKAYNAIISSFAPVIIGHRSDSQKSIATSSEALLQSLDCTATFGKQLLHIRCIPSRTTTLANLTYLATKLLPLVSRHRAAVTIQRAIRARRASRIAHERISLMRLAKDCFKVAIAKQELYNAATCVQRMWRSVQAARVSRLNTEVGTFQSAARVFLARQMMKRCKQGDHALDHSRRGGW